MTAPEGTREWGAVYKMDRAERDATPDVAREACERNIRESARAAGHEPVGAVTITWLDTEPAGDPRVDGIERSLEPDPHKVWAATSVFVRPNGAIAPELRTCNLCGGKTRPAMTMTDAGPVITIRCPNCDA